ncbi:MAG: aldo/keto reductase [Ornithinimicrobium sp.]|uniref:aldo/keto reductase n=1 Tax=Ornithinimicrobium sp. TaxID=1977084 RepID=UPI0026DFE624|nr:aldo/keto reductase [Ornithinimicrobium sp.]MDO5740729.1 aldo/keto reductase [Ornithinimicrobium sp.]
MQTRHLGPFTVSAIGLGAMPFSLGKTPLPTEEAAIATVHAALEAGVTYIDTADIYAPTWDSIGHNERIIAKALRAYRDTSHVIVGTKGGITRSEGEQWGRDGSPGYLRSAVEASLRALGTDVIDLYQWHRPDRWRIYGEVVSTFKDLQTEGKIRAVGISNANVEEIDVALEVLGEGGLASVQNQFSPQFRTSRAELDHCREHQVAFLPWGPLGGSNAAGDVGRRYPAFHEIGEEHAVSAQQVVIAWELSLGEHVIPIPGASRPASITDSARASQLELTEEELARIEGQFR